MEEVCSRKERNIIVYDFKEFPNKQEAINHAKKMNRWKMPAGQRMFFRVSREVSFLKMLHVEKYILAFNFDEYEGSLSEAMEEAKKNRTYLEGRTKIFRVDQEISWPEGTDDLFKKTIKKVDIQGG